MQHTNIRLVVFDMAGTTVHDEDFVAEALCSALEKHGYPIELADARKMMGIAKPIAIQILLDQYQYSGASVPDIHQDFLDNMIRLYETHPRIQAMEGTEKVFRILKENGIKIALDTGFSRDITDVILKRLKWDGQSMLDATVASDEVASGRPAPDMIYKAMELTGVTEISQVVKVGDTAVDMQQGTAAGCALVIGVSSGAYTAADLALYPHTHIVGSVKDIPALLELEAVV